MRFKKLMAIPVSVAMASFGMMAGTGPPANAALPMITCSLAVPANPTSAAALATPWQLTGNGCAEVNDGDSVFVQAAVISPDLGDAVFTHAAVPAIPAAAAKVPAACKRAKFRNHHKKKCKIGIWAPKPKPPVTLPPVLPPAGGANISIYSPLVTTAGIAPAIAPVVPVIPAGSTVGVWGGANTMDIHLVGPGATSCVNGLNGSDFGQFFYCGAANFFKVANADVTAGLLAVPPLGTAAGGAACPSATAYSLVDQDPSDNLETSYLVNPITGATAQNTAFNRFALPGDQVLVNPSDEKLLGILDGAIGCTVWTAPNLADPGVMVQGLALNQIQAHFFQQAPVANVPLLDEMTLFNNNENALKVALYRIGVDEAMPTDLLGFVTTSDTTWCLNLAAIAPAFLAHNMALLLGQPSPIPAMANSLFTFMAQRFVATYENVMPEPGVLPTCDMLTGIADPVTVTFTGGVATSATINLVGD